MPTISRERAAALVSAAKATVLKQAEVPDPPRSAAHFAFTTLYQALAENIHASGRANVAVTYRELSLLASQRRKGKKIMASSLRKPFSEMLWKGSLLDEPFTDGGLSLSVHLRPAGRRGQPLTLQAHFLLNGESATIDRGDPKGAQPIVEEARRAAERAAIQRNQANLARRFIDTLRDSGFERAEDLSRWFERRGVRVPTSFLVAVLIFLTLLASAGAAYAVIRYARAHGLVYLRTKPDQQGQLPPALQPGGEPVHIQYFKGWRLEGRVAPQKLIFTAVFDDIPLRRQYPDSNFQFAWDISIDGHRTTKVTEIPQIECPTSAGIVGTKVSLSVIETCAHEANIFLSKDKPPAALDRSGRVIARGEHIVDDNLDRGWLAGIAAVLPQPCSSDSRNSPITAIQVPGGQVRFFIRHGPVRRDESVLKMSFGDGRVWTSTEQPWQPAASASGDTWDQWQTVIDHAYTRPGKFDVRFALYRRVDTIWNAHREASGTAFVGVPLPKTAPVAPRWGLEKVLIDGGAPGSATATASLAFNLTGAGSIRNSNLIVRGAGGRFIAPQVTASMIQNDPHAVAFGVVPPPLSSPTSYQVSMDFGDGRPPKEMTRRDYHQGAVLGTGHEYLRSGTYQLTISATGQNGQRAFELRRHIHVFADAPPEISE
jgi:hypothetical protein